MNFVIKRVQIVFLFFLLLLCFKTAYSQSIKYTSLQKIIEQYTKQHLAGVAVYVKIDTLQEWIGVAGFQNKENGLELNSENIFSLGSIGKMYNAVAILKLVEDGKLSLDDLVSNYLSKDIIANLPNSDIITIKHLLSHQSGLVNYEVDTQLNELYLGGKLKLDTLSHLNTLKRYVFGKPSKFIPGSSYEYSSTNYVLLAMIVDSISLEGHTENLRKLLREHHFNNTFYRETPKNKLTQHYGDINGDAFIENLTNQTVETTNWFMGDDGIYASIGDAAHFLQALMHSILVTQKTLNQMMTWNKNDKPDYGLGLMADKGLPYKFLVGHSGRGIGSTTDLFYFPHKKMTVAIFCNTGIRQSSPIIKKEYLKMRSKIVKKLFLF
jgi:D-alanyl-D-alanine carboxypeptidase